MFFRTLTKRFELLVIHPIILEWPTVDKAEMNEMVVDVLQKTMHLCRYLHQEDVGQVNHQVKEIKLPDLHFLFCLFVIVENLLVHYIHGEGTLKQ